MFSELVDDVVTKTGRRDRKLDIVGYANASIRECQCLQLFYKDMVEDTIIATASPHIWTFPTNMRRMKTVRNTTQDRWPVLRHPGKRQQEDVEATVNGYYYAASTYFVFSGANIGDEIDVAYYTYLRPLKYYAEGERPASFDYYTGEWSYLTAVTDEDKLAAQQQVANWLLYNWKDLILEGALSKLWAKLKDDRGATSYSLYKQMQQTLISGEAYESLTN